jgi:hypothetical protein
MSARVQRVCDTGHTHTISHRNTESAIKMAAIVGRATVRA